MSAEVVAFVSTEPCSAETMKSDADSESDNGEADDIPVQII